LKTFSVPAILALLQVRVKHWHLF